MSEVALALIGIGGALILGAVGCFAGIAILDAVVNFVLGLFGAHIDFGVGACFLGLFLGLLILAIGIAVAKE